MRNQNYWCTWGVQNGVLNGLSSQGARDGIDAKRIFDPSGWALTEFRSVKAHLYMMLDDGWDVPFGMEPSKTPYGCASLDPDQVRFPGFGSTRVERLKTLNARLIDAGWQGAGLWVACQCHGEGGDRPLKNKEDVRVEWTRKLEDSVVAGIGYWKVDWGARGMSVEFRRTLSELKRATAPDMSIEHAPAYRVPFNALGKGDSIRETAWSDYDAAVFEFSDVVRIYDMLQPIDNAVTMDRIAYYSDKIDRFGYGTLLNVEGSVLHGAVLGHSFGVMRAKLLGKRALFGQVADSSRLNERIAEVARAVNWQELAPAFGGQLKTIVSDEVLTDEWQYRKGEGWMSAVWGKEVRQKAPQSVARGAPLPHVTAHEAEKPYVCVGSNPNGAMAVGVLPRVKGGRWYTPRADVRLAGLVRRDAPLGVFGELSSLTVPMSSRPSRIFASDLAGGVRHDITASVSWTDAGLVLPGEMLVSIGREAAPSDPSAPGVLLEFR